jgi:molybdenum cofactor cytidylyltransferase
VQLSKALRIAPGDVVAFVGGGGKTTAMFRLAEELAQKQVRVLTTTSTRIFAAQIKRAPAHVTFDPQRQSSADILPQLETALDKHSHVLLIGQTDEQSGKAFGLPSEIIDYLAAGGHFDVIINEADGSRMRPFKAPAEHEPVIPASTTLVAPMVGLDVLGQPLRDDFVHRAERVSYLSNTPVGQPVTINTIAATMRHPDGGLKNIPAQARVIPLLNKVESHKDLAAARQIAEKLLACPQINSVALGAVRQPDSPVAEVYGRVAAVVLAAGGSSRFGSPKQLARWGEQSFIERAVEAALASQAEPVLVVLGAEVEQSRALLANYPVQIIQNKRWAEGQSTSMQAGLAHLPAHINGVIFHLVDQPAVTPDVIDALIGRYRQTLAPVIWPEFEGKRGNPVLFDRRLFAELAQIGGDIGGRPVLIAHQHEAERVIVTNEGVLLDFDRPQDLANQPDGRKMP